MKIEQHIKDLTPVIGQLYQMTDTIFLEPELSNNVKKAIGKLEQAMKVNDPKEIEVYVGKIAQFFLRGDLYL